MERNGVRGGCAHDSLSLPRVFALSVVTSRKSTNSSDDPIRCLEFRGVLLLRHGEDYRIRAILPGLTLFDNSCRGRLAMWDSRNPREQRNPLKAL